MKKIFTLFAVLAMVMSMSAVNMTGGEELYLTPNSNWLQKDGNGKAPRFAIYVYGSGGDSWASMTAVEGENNLYKAVVPNGNWTNVIFCRMNGGTASNGWGNKYNQTGNLTYNGTQNWYTVKDGTWDNGGGTWALYAPEAPKSYKDITITIVANATPKIHYWGGGDKMVGTVWENLPEMTATGEANTYSCTIKDVDEAIGVKYLIKVGEVQSADQQAFNDVKVNFKDLLPQVVVKGVNSWDDIDIMTVSDDYLSASITLSLAANKAYALKLTVNGEWFGSKTIAITKDKNSAKFDTNGDGDGKITTDLAGDYVFTYTYANQTLTVTYPAQTITLSYDITSENIRNSDGRQTISVEDENYDNPQLVIPGFSVEVAEYTEASLSINGETLKATATYTVDAESGTEVYTATATTADGSIIYNVTFTYALPTTQNYELYAMGISATVESEEGLTTYYLKGNAILGEEYVPVEFMFDNMGNAEGTIGDVFAVGMGEGEQEGNSVSGVVLLEDESGNTYRIEFTAEIEQPEVEIVVKEEVNVALYNLTVDVQGTMAMVSAGTEELSFWLTLLQTENHYGDYTNDAFSNIWYGDDQLYAAYGEKHTYGVTDGKVNFVVSFITSPDAEGNVTKYNFTLYAGEKPLDPTALDNLNTTVAPVKMIENGQLIIVKDGVQYNAQGAVVK